MLRQGRDPLLGADHVGDPHQVVVYDVGEVVRGVAVALEQHLVVHQVVVDADLAAQQVGDGGLALARHRQADHVRLPRGAAPRRLGGRERAAVAVVAERVRDLLPSLLLAQRFEALPGAEARVRGAAGDELLGVVAVDREALALAVRPVRAADVRPLVPRKAQPAQRLEDHALGGRVRALAVGVLDAQDELPAVLLRPGVVEQRHVRRADVRVAGRAGSDSRSHHVGHRRVSTFARAGACAPANASLPAAARGRDAALPSRRWACERPARRPAEVDTAQGWPTIGVPAVLGSRPTAGHVALDHGIGVRIPAPQPIGKHPRSTVAGPP